MLNKRGYVLVYAIGVIVLLMLLGATLTRVTLQRSYWTDKQVHNIKQVNKAKTQVDAAASELANYFDSYTNNYNRYLYQLKSDFEVKFIDIENRYDVEIVDVTSDQCNSDSDSSCKYYTSQYAIQYTDGDLTAKKKFFLSMIPSYLYFALGSKSDLTLNGGTNIDGDIYVGHDLYLTNGVNYILDNVFKQQETTFSTIEPGSSLYIENNLYSCSEGINCYTIDTSENFIQNEAVFITITDNWESQTTFYATTPPPLIKKYQDRFLDVDFDASYLYYLNEAIRLPGEQVENNRDFTLSDSATLTQELQDLSSDRLYPVTDTEEIDSSLNQSVYLYSPDDNEIEIDSNFEFSKDNDKWVIVDGDLKLGSYGERITVDANILVTGNITITGNIILDSTIYTLGKGLIHAANISNTTANQLVLLTKDNLQFSRFNEGATIDTSEYVLKGFFYTDRNANIFTADSYISIEGGLFAGDIENFDVNNPTDFVYATDAIGLVINSYRGEVSKDETGENILFHPTEEARFMIKYSTDVIVTQPKGLPLNKHINYLFEDITIK